MSFISSGLPDTDYRDDDTDGTCQNTCDFIKNSI